MSFQSRDLLRLIVLNHNLLIISSTFSDDDDGGDVPTSYGVSIDSLSKSPDCCPPLPKLKPQHGKHFLLFRPHIRPGADHWPGPLGGKGFFNISTNKRDGRQRVSKSRRMVTVVLDQCVLLLAHFRYWLNRVGVRSEEGCGSRIAYESW